MHHPCHMCPVQFVQSRALRLGGPFRRGDQRSTDLLDEPFLGETCPLLEFLDPGDQFTLVRSLLRRHVLTGFTPGLLS